MDTDDRAENAAALLAVPDIALRDEVRRTAAAADCALTEAGGPITRQIWLTTSLVVLDRTTALRCVHDGLPRRPGVVLVSAGTPVVDDWQAATAVGAERVIELPARSAELVGVLGDRAPLGAQNGVVLAVVGGRGGAGASTAALALAFTARSTGFRPYTLLVDGDFRGGGLDLALGIEEQPGLRWSGLVVEAGRVAGSALHDALPSAGPGLAVLSCARGDDASELTVAGVDAVTDAGRAAGDLVVCDVGRADGTIETAFLEAADLVVVVVPAELRACAAAESVIAAIARRNPNQGVLVRGPAPGGLRAGEVAAALGVPLLAAMRPQPRLAEQLERGGFRLGRRAPLRRAAAQILDVLATRPHQARWAI